jgi:HAD superfamily hydrolase (TIGR01509 family)
MDGTLVDTEPYWIESEFSLAERYSGRWSREHALTLVGRDLLDAGRYIREHMGIDLTPEQIVEDLLDGVVARVRREVPWRPGARELLAALRAAGVPCALVTMSYQRFVAPILEHLPPETFRVVVTGDVLINGKPHPEPYLTAAAALGVSAADCLAIEDSSTGVTSAEAAGCQVLVVPNHVTVPTGPRRIFRDTLVGLGLDELCAMCPAATAAAPALPPL